MTDLKKNVLDLIKDKKIKPKPKSYFIFKNLAIWLISASMFLFASVCMQLTYCTLHCRCCVKDFAMVSDPNTFICMLIYALPYFWIILFIVFCYISYLLYRVTPRGYRYKTGLVAICMVLLCVSFGIVFESVKCAGGIDRYLADNFHIYNIIRPQEDILWNNPTKGILCGVIIRKINNSTYEFIDPLSNKWCLKAESRTVQDEIDILVGGKVKISGCLDAEDNFVVKNIKKWNK